MCLKDGVARTPIVSNQDTGNSKKLHKFVLKEILHRLLILIVACHGASSGNGRRIKGVVSQKTFLEFVEISNTEVVLRGISACGEHSLGTLI